MTNVYCISGLGADRRIFGRLNIKNANLVHVPWINVDENDDMQTYARKIAQLIPAEARIILGVSFGGMLAVEVGKVKKIETIIIVSSAKTTGEKPWVPHIFRWLHRIMPAFIYTIPNPLLYWFFGAENKEDRKVLREILITSDAALVKRFISFIFKWDNEQVPGNIVHIHGNKDRLMPAKDITASYWVKNGGHMIIYNRAAEVSTIIEQEINSLQ